MGLFSIKSVSVVTMANTGSSLTLIAPIHVSNEVSHTVSYRVISFEDCPISVKAIHPENKLQ